MPTVRDTHDRHVNLRIPQDTWDSLEALANGESVSSVIREAIAAHLARFERTKKAAKTRKTAKKVTKRTVKRR